MTASIEVGPGSHWKLFGELLRPHRRALSGFGLVLAAATALPLAGPLILRAFIDQAVDGSDTGHLVTLAIVYAVLGTLAAIAQIGVDWRATTLTWRITNGLRHDLADHVLHADLAFFRDTTPGQLITRIDDDVTAMNDFISRFVIRFVSVGMIGLSSLVVVTVIEPILALPVGAFLGIAARVVWVRRDRAVAESMAEREATADVMGFVEEAIGGVDDLTTLSAGPFAVRRLAERAQVMVAATRERARAQMRLIGTVRVTLAAGEMLVLGAGAAGFGRGWISIGTVFLGYRFVGIVKGPVEVLVWQLQELQGAGGAARRVMLLLDERTSVRRGETPLPDGALSVILDRVGLSYDADECEVLSDVTMVVEAGHRVGLIGRTGSGKTSLARLILGLVEPNRGSVRIGGVDIREVEESSLRRRVTAVPQDVQLFPGTVRDNVSLFDAAVDDERIRQAIERVGLDCWLADQPDGLDARIGSISSTAGLSAGEAQLLSLARVHLRDPDVVVLDEATSRIDPHTQELLQVATEELLRGRAAIIIAHRLETLAACDDIAVLEGGRLAEFGRREALAADPESHYARLLRASDAVEEELA